MSEVSRAGFHSTAPPEAAETVAESGNTVGKITAKADPKSPLPSYSKRQGGRYGLGHTLRKSLDPERIEFGILQFEDQA